MYLAFSIFLSQLQEIQNTVACKSMEHSGDDVHKSVHKMKRQQNQLKSLVWV